MELRYDKRGSNSTSSAAVSVVTQHSLSGGHRRVGRWASLRRHKLQHSGGGDGDDVDSGYKQHQHVPGGQRGGAIHGSLRHFKSPPAPATPTITVQNALHSPRCARKLKKKAHDHQAAESKKAKEAETEEEQEEPTRLRVVRAFGLSRSGKHKVSSPAVAPSANHTTSNRDHERAAPYYCVVQVCVVELKGHPPVRAPPSKKTAPLLRATLDGRLCSFGGLRVEEVSWGQTVEIPSDGPQELIVEFRVYARRRYLPDRLVGRAELSLRGGQPQNQNKLTRQRFRTLVLEKGEGEPRALLEIIFDPPQSRKHTASEASPSFPFLCSDVEAMRMLAYGRGSMHIERSFLGMLPPELVERLCELVEHNAGFDPFRDGEATHSAQRDRQHLAETMRMRATSATHRWKMMRVRSVPSGTLSRQSMAPMTSPKSPCLAPNVMNHTRAHTSSMEVQATPESSDMAASESLYLSSPCNAARPPMLPSTGPPRYTSLSFWHPQDLADPIVVRGSRRKGYLTTRAMEAGNEHTLTDKHTLCYLQSVSRSDQTFMIREFRESTHKAFVWNEESLAEYVRAIEKRLQTVAVLEQQRRMLIGGIPALGCTFAISVPARALHTVHKRGLREYEVVSVWFVIVGRSCLQFQYTTCTQNPSQSLSTALLAHRKAEDSNFVWMLRTFGWRQEAHPRKRAPPAPTSPAPSPAQ